MGNRINRKVSSTIFLLLMSCIYCFNLNAQENKSATIIKGKIVLAGKQANKARLEDVFIYYKPDELSLMPQSNPLPEPFNIEMKNKAYVPRVSVIPVGSEVRIENGDSILHNAFSPSRPNHFDLGLYKRNAGKIQRLSKPGVVKLFCNVHYHMVAYVLVLDTPYYARVKKDGSFEIKGVELQKNINLNKGKLTIWHERAKKVIIKINLPISDELAFNLPITKRRIPEHKNKSGKSYKRKKRRRRY